MRRYKRTDEPFEETQRLGHGLGRVRTHVRVWQTLIMNQLLCYILNKQQVYCKVSFCLVWHHLEKIDYLEMFGICQVQFVPEF